MAQNYKLQNKILVKVARNSACALIDQYHNPMSVDDKNAVSNKCLTFVGYIIIIFLT